MYQDMYINWLYINLLCVQVGRVYSTLFPQSLASILYYSLVTGPLYAHLQTSKAQTGITDTLENKINCRFSSDTCLCRMLLFQNGCDLIVTNCTGLCAAWTSYVSWKIYMSWGLGKPFDPFACFSTTSNAIRQARHRYFDSRYLITNRTDYVYPRFTMVPRYLKLDQSLAFTVWGKHI